MSDAFSEKVPQVAACWASFFDGEGLAVSVSVVAESLTVLPVTAPLVMLTAADVESEGAILTPVLVSEFVISPCLL